MQLKKKDVPLHWVDEGVLPEGPLVISFSVINYVVSMSVARERHCSDEKKRPVRVSFFVVLFYVEQQAFEVFPFRMVDVDRMVGRLAQAVQDPYAAPGLGRCGKHRQGKGFLVHHLRAAEGKYQSAGRYL